MKQTTLNMLSNHALSIITGCLAGMVFIAGMSNMSSSGADDYWQTVGSLSAGFGTIGLLIIAIFSANVWIKSIKSEKLTTMKHENLNSYLATSKSIYYICVIDYRDRFRRLEDIDSRKCQELLSQAYAYQSVLEKLSWIDQEEFNCILGEQRINIEQLEKIF